MAGYDPSDECSVDLPVADMVSGLNGSLAGVKIGIPTEYFFDAAELNAEVKAAVLAAVEAMRSAGASVVEVRIPHAALARDAQRIIMFSEAYAYHEPDLQSRPELYGKYTRQQIRQGAFFSAVDFVQANRVRSLVKAEALAALSDVDVLITPTMLNTAPTYAGYDFDAQINQPSFMGIWNLTGMPALSVCCGFSSEKLPIGMQLVGRPFAEPTVFRVGDAYQAITEWHLAVPTAFAEAAVV
jgi:aspartyl-tRNA(Asn)/glutamyl-tRNA(Gln) amidotransferase subunit A